MLIDFSDLLTVITDSYQSNCSWLTPVILKIAEKLSLDAISKSFSKWINAVRQKFSKKATLVVPSQNTNNLYSLLNCQNLKAITIDERIEDYEDKNQQRRIKRTTVKIETK